MSKIFDAYKKRLSEAPEIGLEISRAGKFPLYPPLKPSQMDEFGKLANQLLRIKMPGRGGIVSFASSAPQEGSSYVSFHAASMLAQIYDQKVAWVDCNFLSPQSKLLGSRNIPLSDLLQDPSQIDEMPIDNNPMLISAGADLSRTKSLFADENYGVFLEKMSSRFDYVVLDLPPVLKCNDSALIALGSDGLLLIIEHKYLKWEVINHGAQSLKEKGVKILGTVINRRQFDLPKAIYDRL
jgi:Mrp family chromosome partitioning ATPase